ncbi:MAG: DUF3618 domain-containing protein [Rubrobacteraceae bacterium]
MSEIPERIEREMFEIRNRMAPDVKDLRKHTEPQAIGKQVGDKVKTRVKTTLSNLGKSIASSAKKQFRSAQEAGRKRNPSKFTAAVKSDPRPMVILALFLAVTVMAARKISNGRHR